MMLICMYGITYVTRYKSKINMVYITISETVIGIARMAQW